MSLAGLISTHPVGDVTNDFLVPKVAKGSVFNSNTHCFAFVDSQLRLFSTRVSKWSDAKLINGAFCDTAAYKEVAKTIRKVVTLQESMALCVSQCKKIVALHSDLPVDRLIRLMDYIKGQGDHSEDYEELSRLCAMRPGRMSAIRVYRDLQRHPLPGLSCSRICLLRIPFYGQPTRSAVNVGKEATSRVNRRSQTTARVLNEASRRRRTPGQYRWRPQSRTRVERW